MHINFKRLTFHVSFPELKMALLLLPQIFKILSHFLKGTVVSYCMFMGNLMGFLNQKLNTTDIKELARKVMAAMVNKEAAEAMWGKK